MSILATLAGFGARGLSFLGSIRSYLIVGAVATVVAGAYGWYAGSTHEAKIMAAAAVHAVQEAQKAQAKKDAADWKEAKKDYDMRHAADVAANDRLAGLLKNRKASVPNPTRAFVPAASMAALNDPALVGETQ